MIELGFYPPTKRQKLRQWYRRQQAATPASASIAPDVRRPRFGAAVWLLAAFLALIAALLFGAVSCQWSGLYDLAGVCVFAIPAVSIGAALLLEFPALRAVFG